MTFSRLAASGIVERREGYANGQILFAVFIEPLLGTAFLLGNSGARKHITTNTRKPAP